jgi:hypothetical protein
MTADERQKRVDRLMDSTQEVFDMLVRLELTVMQGKIAADLLQLMTDLLDLSDNLARRSQVR